MARGGVKDAVKYGFAVGRVRVLENRLLGRPTFDRLLEAGDFAEQKRIIGETYIGKYLESAWLPDDVEAGLDASLEDLFEEFLEKANLPEPIVRFFRLPYDFANLKARLKRELLGLETDAGPSALGTLSPTGVPNDEMPDGMREAVESLSSGDEATGVTGPDEERIETVIDESMFAALLAEARASRSPFLAGLADMQVDAANVRVLLRARRMGWAAAEAREHLVEGGTLPIEGLMDAYAKSEADLAEEITRHEPFRAYSSSELLDLERLDLITDNTTVRYLKRARMIPIGPEPVIGYVMARQAEVAALRILLVGKLQGLPTELLRSRLRELYS